MRCRLITDSAEYMKEFSLVNSKKLESYLHYISYNINKKHTFFISKCQWNSKNSTRKHVHVHTHCHSFSQNIAILIKFRKQNAVISPNDCELMCCLGVREDELENFQIILIRSKKTDTYYFKIISLVVYL